MDDEFKAFANVVVWKISKVERTHPMGLSKFTITQELYDNEDWSIRMIDSAPHITDEANVYLGYDYYYHGRDDAFDIDNTGKIEITYSGEGTIRVGMQKSFSFHSYDSSGIEQDDIPDWNIIYGEEFEGISSVISEDGKTITIKCDRIYSIIGKRFTIQASIDDRLTTIEVEVVG